VTEVEDTMTSKQRHVNGNGVEARLEALKADLDALQDDMRGLLTDVKGVASNGVTEAMQTARTAASEAAERVEDWANDNADSVRAAVRKQPLAACALSMSAGALIGALLLRR
jgi:ElaB/YqjD/DUF883 family membrane-anchored ribosome-binding protein